MMKSELQFITALIAKAESSQAHQVKLVARLSKESGLARAVQADAVLRAMSARIEALHLKRNKLILEENSTVPQSSDPKQRARDAERKSD